jgi:hypothetical protein
MHRSRFRSLLCAVAVLAMTGAGGAPRQSQPAGDPFAFLSPDVVLSEAQRERLDRDEVIAETLHGEGGQIAIFVATRLKAPPDALVVWTRAIAELKRSKYVLAIGRFSDPPQLSDLSDLALDERDLQAIRLCLPGKCSLKLSAAEIASLGRAVAAGGEAWQEAVQAEFRGLMVARVRQYQGGGLAAVPPMANRKKPFQLAEGFDEILAQSAFVTRVPKLGAWLHRYPAAVDPSVESFFYWSKESYGTGKPVISITHVGMIRSSAGGNVPAVVVAGKQIFATHYLDGSLGITMVLRNTGNDVPYLVYLNRSRVDILKGFWGGLVRRVLESRVERDAPQIVRGLRARLESGESPGLSKP